MSLKMPNKGGGDFQRPPAGTTLGICYGVIDIGLQQTTYQGLVNVKPQVILLFEMCNELMDDGRPFGVSKVYTASMHEKAKLRLDIQSWRGKAMTDEEADDFNLVNVLGKAALLNITETVKGDRTYTNIAGISPVMKGMTVPQPHNTLVVYDMDDPDPAVLEKLPEWIKKKIAASQNDTQQGSNAYGRKKDVPDPDPFNGEGFADDDIPW